MTEEIETIEEAAKKDAENNKVYRCFNCGYIMEPIQFNSLKCDVGCPGCKGSLANFFLRSVFAEEKSDK